MASDGLLHFTDLQGYKARVMMFSLLRGPVFFLPGIKPPFRQPLGLAKYLYRLILPAIFSQQAPDILLGLRPSAPGTLLPFLSHESDLIASKARHTSDPKKTTGRIITLLNHWHIQIGPFFCKIHTMLYSNQQIYIYVLVALPERLPAS
jgi:hypothetical protein